MFKATAFGLAFLGIVAAAQADVYITEYMYKGEIGEFVEFTNLGDTAVDMTGWSYDDDSRLVGAFDLSAFGIVEAGESVVLTEGVASEFIADWSLSGVKVVGEYTNNLGSNDEINLYDEAGALVDRLTYGYEDFVGSIRTNNVSGNPISLSDIGANDAYGWQLSVEGDAYGSYTSALGDVGNPGINVPEPATLGLMVVGAYSFVRRR